MASPGSPLPEGLAHIWVYGHMHTHIFSLSLPLCIGSNTLPGNLRAKFAGHVYQSRRIFQF